MAKEILSLKSLYRLLTENDYPIYTTGVMREENRKGLTLIKFWQEILLYDFKSKRYGKIIWRTTGSRNRYLSGLCNRREELHFYEDYAAEVVSVLTEEQMGRQMESIVRFMKERQFDYDIFLKKLETIIELYHEQDTLFDEEIYHFLKDVRISREMDKCFLGAWYFTMLTVLALCGTALNGDAIKKRLQTEYMQANACWRSVGGSDKHERVQINFLTGKNSEICATPLEQKHFFGREAVMFDLLERLGKGGYYLISGVGGSGKTELLRQLFKQCQEEKLVDAIGVIQYNSSLLESFLHAFGQVQGDNAEEKWLEIMATLRRLKNQKVLLLIDNLEQSEEDKEKFETLRDIDVTIFVSSRLSYLEGFEIYSVNELSEESAMLIFRDNYKGMLTAADRQMLRNKLKDGTWCHILTMRLFGKLANQRGWSVSTLMEQYSNQENKVVGIEGEKQISLKALYQNLYQTAEIEKEKKQILEMFSILPYKGYSAEIVLEYFWNGLSLSQTESEMETLSLRGWLEKKDTEYVMHPFIAECIRRKDCNEEDIAYFIKQLRKRWGLSEDGNHYEKIRNLLKSPEEHYFAEIVIHLSGMIVGEVSEIAMETIVAASVLEVERYDSFKTICKTVTSVYSRCKTLKDEWKVWLGICACRSTVETEGSFVDFLVEQCNNRTVELSFYWKAMAAYAEYLTAMGNREAAMSLWMEIVDNPEIEGYYVKCCTHLGLIFAAVGNWGMAEEWMEKGENYIRKRGTENVDDIEQFYNVLFVVYNTQGKVEKAKQALELLGRYTRNREESQHRVVYWHHKGVMEAALGNYEEAVKILRRSVEEMWYYNGNDISYMSTCADLAGILAKLQWFSEAEEYYLKAFEWYRQNADNLIGQYHMLVNNMGVMYWDWGKLEKALEYLQLALEPAKQIGGIALAETQNNLARACYEKGMNKPALEYGEASYPVLLNTYGSQHPKVIAAKERLELLK